MSSTSVTLYEVNVYDGERWNTNMTTYDRKSAVARAELLKKDGAKWSLWKRTERSEMIGSSFSPKRSEPASVSGSPSPNTSK